MQEDRTVCFFPWLSSSESASFSGFQLIPYPGEDHGRFAQEDVATIEWATQGFLVARLATRFRKTTLLVLDGKEPLDRLSEEEHRTAFAFAELLAFCALSNRIFFFPLGGYCNRGAFQLVIQEVKGTDGSRGRTYTKRRRDGFTSVLDMDQERLILRPSHIEPPFSFPNQLDKELLEALLGAREKLPPDRWTQIWDSIVGFNLANTDSPEFTEHLEVVFLLGAFQRLLDCGSKMKALSAPLRKILQPHHDCLSSDVARFSGKLSKDEQSFPVRDLWIRDFYEMRGEMAHGKRASDKRQLWTLHDHLLLGSFVFPLALKRVLSVEGLYGWTKDDARNLEAFEALASEEHLSEERGVIESGDSCPWHDIFQRFLFMDL